jgi:nucleotide-binding universal stress UspA family protein
MNDVPILICYDATDASDHAIEVAAKLFAGRRAVVLDVGPPLTVAQSSVVIVPDVPIGSFEKINEGDAMQQARVGAEQARRVGFDAEARAIVEAPTWEGIVDTADDIDAAVIVLGSHAIGGFRELFEGSVPHDVAEHAGRPVLVVPPERRRK